MVNNKFVHATI